MQIVPTTAEKKPIDAHEIAALADARRKQLEERLQQLDGERSHIKAELALLPAARKPRKARKGKEKVAE